MKRTLLLVSGISLVLLALLVTPTTLLVLFMLPERYQSTARLQISAPPEIQIPAPPEIKEPLAQRGVPYWVQTEAEVVQSKAVLYKVVERLDLGGVWGKKYKADGVLPREVAYGILKSGLEVRPVPNTSLLAIRYETESPGEAALIANEIATVYLAAAMARAKEAARPGRQVTEPASIIDPAEPSPRPIDSKPPRIALAVLISVLLAVPGGIMIFRAIRRPGDAQPKFKGVQM